MEIAKIFLTSGLTIIGGVSIFVTGQIIVRFIIDPIHELNKLKGSIAYSLIFYSDIYMNPPPAFTVLGDEIKKRDEVQKVFREQASQLCPKASIIPWYKIWELLRIIPKSQNVISAASELIGLSNSIHRVDIDSNNMRRKKIAKLLNIKIGIGQ